MLTARRQTKSNKGKNALTINEGIMAARPERVAISPLGVTCKGGLGKNSSKRVGRRVGAEFKFDFEANIHRSNPGEFSGGSGRWAFGIARHA